MFANPKMSPKVMANGTPNTLRIIDDKKAIIITIAIILGLGLLLWILPFTHQFMEDFLFLRF